MAKCSEIWLNLNTIVHSVYRINARVKGRRAKFRNARNNQLMILDTNGSRKYLNPAELQRLIVAAGRLSPKEHVFCLFLVFSGCRISEALSLTADHIDRANKTATVLCLKRRQSGLYRTIPLPDRLIDALARHMDSNDLRPHERVWAWGRTKGWMVVKSAMLEAGISGAKACPKGLRHAFAIASIDGGVPLNMIQKWMGHSRLETTAIYTNACGSMERRIADRFWQALDTNAT
jgi:integrase/recombinase XerD